MPECAMPQKTISFSADHGGFRLKQHLIAHAKERGLTVLDLGTHNEERCDTFDYAVAMADALKQKKADLGVIICKSGNGIAMVANRFAHIRAAVAHNQTTARLAREHNDANVMSLGAAMVGDDVARDCFDAFMDSECLGGRYAERRMRLDKFRWTIKEQP